MYVYVVSMCVLGGGLHMWVGMHMLSIWAKGPELTALYFIPWVRVSFWTRSFHSKHFIHWASSQLPNTLKWGWKGWLLRNLGCACEWLCAHPEVYLTPSSLPGLLNYWPHLRLLFLGLLTVPAQYGPRIHFQFTPTFSLLCAKQRSFLMLFFSELKIRHQTNRIQSLMMENPIGVCLFFSNLLKEFWEPQLSISQGDSRNRCMEATWRLNKSRFRNKLRSYQLDSLHNCLQ